MKNPNEIYTLEWYRREYDPALQLEFDAAADAIVDLFRPHNAIDIGCGPGMLVDALLARRVLAYGIDGSAHAIEHSSPRVRPFLSYLTVQDLARFPLADRYELVICTEVAEHLEAENAEQLVTVLCDRTAEGGSIVWTAAPVGQDGHDHVNCQDPPYWIAKFEARGFVIDEDKTILLKRMWGLSLVRLSHLTRNVLIFRKAA